MWAMAALAGAQALSSLAGGLFGRSSAKKAARNAAEAKARADAYNLEMITRTNVKNEALGRELLDVPLEQFTTNSFDASAFHAAAAEAGFNPQTFLNAGGLSAFTNQHVYSKGHNAVAAYQMMMPQTHQIDADPTQRIPSVGEIGFSALSDGLKTFGEGMARADQQAHQQSMLSQQLAAIQSSSNRNSRQLGVPGFSTSGSQITSRGSGGLAKPKTKAISIDLGDPSAPERDGTKFVNPYVNWRVDPTSPNGEAAEDRYGDGPVAFGHGIVTQFDDIFYNLTGTTHKQRAEIRQRLWGQATNFFGGLSRRVMPATP